MVATDVANHRVLYRIEILELVDEDDVPPRGDPPDDLRFAEEVRRLEHQLIEVDEMALVEEALIALEDVAVARVLE